MLFVMFLPYAFKVTLTNICMIVNFHWEVKTIFNGNARGLLNILSKFMILYESYKDFLNHIYECSSNILGATIHLNIKLTLQN